MDLIDKGILVATSDRNEKGTQIDAEEKPAEQVLEGSFPVTMANGQSVADYTKGKAAGFAIPSSVRVTGRSVEFATNFKHRCGLCLNFDNIGFLKWKLRSDLGTPAQRLEVDALRGQVMEREPEIGEKHVGADGDFDVEHALNTCGLCRALTSIFKEEAIMWPESGCPDYRGSDMVPIEQRVDYSSLFRPRNKEAVADGDSGYDAILKSAQGQVKRSTQRIDWKSALAKLSAVESPTVAAPQTTAPADDGQIPKK